jgi:hypothetical protein
LSWTQFELPQPVCALFIGSYCDTIWSRQAIPDGYQERVQSFLSMSESRLWTGMLQCAVSFLGVRHAAEINAISRSREMAPWSVGGDYDRPIARRMLEEAGLPRGSFAIRKKDTSHESAFRWPYSPAPSTSYRSYLTDLGKRPPSPHQIPLIRACASIESLWANNIGWRLRLPRSTRPGQGISYPEMLFRWANEELASIYYREVAKIGNFPV